MATYRLYKTAINSPLVHLKKSTVLLEDAECRLCMDGEEDEENQTLVTRTVDATTRGPEAGPTDRTMNNIRVSHNKFLVSVEDLI